MAKELPYFRFTVQEWQNGDIGIESYELKGLFIDICGFYWIKDCTVDLEMLKKRFSNATSLLEQLISLGILKVDESENIDIVFLNDQFDLLSEKRKKRQKAGRKGGLSKASNAKAMLKQSSSYKDKDKDKDKDNNKEPDFSNLNEGKQLNQFPEPDSEQVQKATKVLAEFFSISEINHSAHYMKIGNFCRHMESCGKFDFFRKQFTAYQEIKSDPNFRHSWKNYIGSPEEKYQDGAWNEKQWFEDQKNKVVSSPRRNRNPQ